MNLNIPHPKAAIRSLPWKNKSYLLASLFLCIGNIAIGDPEELTPGLDQSSDASKSQSGQEKEIIEFFVSAIGSSEPDGSEMNPFPDFDSARDAIRRLRASGQWPVKGVVVNVAAGDYPMNAPLELDSRDSGEPGAPVVWRGALNSLTKIIGGVELADRLFNPVVDEAIIARIPASAKNRVVQTDITALGIKSFDAMPLTGHGQTGCLDSVTDYKSGTQSMELFRGDRALPVARWPDQDNATVNKVLEVGSIVRNWMPDMKGKTKTMFGLGNGYVEPHNRENPPKGFAFQIESSQALRWRTADAAMMKGSWYWDWSDQSVQLAKVDEQGIIYSVQPSAYGIRAEQRFFIYNLLEEMDQPGEWFIDRKTGMMYLIPVEDSVGGYRLSLTSHPFVTAAGASHISLENFAFQLGRANAVSIKGGENIRIVGCDFRALGKNAISVTDGKKHQILNCNIQGTGAGGIFLGGGDRRTLEPAGHAASQNTIRNFSRLTNSNGPAIQLFGVGNRAIGNQISEGPARAIQFQGNDHLISNNEIFRVCLEVDDVGAIVSGRDHTARGTVISNNYVHNILSNSVAGVGVHAVYLDDGISGTEISGNVFQDVGGIYVVINGGRDNLILRNTFISGSAANAVAAERKFFNGRFTAVSISDCMLYERLEGDPFRNPNSVDHKSAPYAKYTGLADMRNDNPGAPKGNKIEKNNYIGIPFFYFQRFNPKTTEGQIREWNTIRDNAVIGIGNKTDTK